MTGGDSLIVSGARCTWWDDINKASKQSAGLPCCPHCKGVLFQHAPVEWWAGVARYEADGHPGYRGLVEWMRGRCFQSYVVAEKAYAEASKHAYPVFTHEPKMMRDRCTCQSGRDSDGSEYGPCAWCEDAPFREMLEAHADDAPVCPTCRGGGVVLAWSGNPPEPDHDEPCQDCCPEDDPDWNAWEAYGLSGRNG